MSAAAAWALAALALAGWLMVFRGHEEWARGLVRGLVARDAPVTARARASSRSLPPEAVGACEAFDRDFQATFGTAALDAPEAHVRKLFAHRARAQRAVGEARMRLPNDLVAERALVAAAEDVDRAMLQHIEDARRRCGAPLVHPGPVDDAWYGAWYRAANDAVE